MKKYFTKKQRDKRSISNIYASMNFTFFIKYVDLIFPLSKILCLEILCLKFFVL